MKWNGDNKGSSAVVGSDGGTVGYLLAYSRVIRTGFLVIVAAGSLNDDSPRRYLQVASQLPLLLAFFKQSSRSRTRPLWGKVQEVRCRQ